MGSPRKSGNTATLVNEILRGGEEEGAETKVYNINAMDIKGCQSCMYCRTHPACSVKDDMEQIYQDIKEADAVVIGSPIYIHQVSGQTKIMMDRFYPLTDEKHKPRFGKRKLVMAYTQAAPFKHIFKKYIKYMRKVFKPMGLDYQEEIIATKCFEPDAVANNDKILKKAFKIGRNL